MALAGDAWKTRAARLSSEPLVHFFVIGALLFLFHRLFAGDPRTIVITPGLEAELSRRFRDQTGRSPSPAEAEAALREWKRDEAIYREALRERLERDDPTIRTVLIDKVRARAAFEIPKSRPTDDELREWLSTHRKLYETPLRYDFELVTFPKSEHAAALEREKFERALADGANPATLGRSIVGGDLTADDLREKFAPDLADRIVHLPPGKWQPAESEDSLVLARVKGIQGGMPAVNDLRDRLIADWSYAAQHRAVDQRLQEIVDRYRFERRP